MSHRPVRDSVPSIKHSPHTLSDRDIRALVKGIQKWGDITVRWTEIVSC